MKQDRAPSPIIPKNPQDRTGAAGILRRCYAEIRKRYKGLQSDVLAIFGGIRILNANDVGTPAIRTIYAMTPEQLGRLSAELAAALERWIASGKDPAHLFWFAAYETEAYHLGTAQSVANLGQLSAAYAASRSLQQVLYSEPYRTRLAAAQLQSMDHWTGLSGALKSELSAIIGRAVVDGKNPKTVRREISERLGVSMAKAGQYAQTDILGALRDSRAAEADQAAEQFGLKIALLWTSALHKTTRYTHAIRHGKVTTTTEVRDFYSKNGNRYNCRCSIVETLIGDGGRPMLSAQAKASFQAARTGWLKSNSPS